MPTRSRTRSLMLTALAIPTLLGAVACATLGRATFKEPIVNFQGAEISSLGITGGSLVVKLSVYNPNGFRLDGTGLTYNLVVDSVRFGSGELKERFTVQEGDSTVVTLPLDFTYAGVGAAGRQLLNTGSVNYRVFGDFTVGTPIGSFKRAYDQTRRFSALSRTTR